MSKILSTSSGSSFSNLPLSSNEKQVQLGTKRTAEARVLSFYGATHYLSWQIIIVVPRSVSKFSYVLLLAYLRIDKKESQLYIIVTRILKSEKVFFNFFNSLQTLPISTSNNSNKKYINNINNEHRSSMICSSPLLDPRCIQAHGYLKIAYAKRIQEWCIIRGVGF